MEETLKTALSQTANKLIQFYGAGAEKEATDHAERCTRRGDTDGSGTWNWIATAISEIQPRPDVDILALSTEVDKA
jgi:hypothetical protein